MAKDARGGTDLDRSLRKRIQNVLINALSDVLLGDDDGDEVSLESGADSTTLVERLQHQGVLSQSEASGADDNISGGFVVYQGDERQLLADLLPEVNGDVVSLGELGSDVLDLHGVGIACWDFDNGLWKDVSDISISVDGNVAKSEEFRRDAVSHKGDIFSSHVAKLDEAVVRDVCALVTSETPIFG